MHTAAASTRPPPAARGTRADAAPRRHGAGADDDDDDDDDDDGPAGTRGQTWMADGACVRVGRWGGRLEKRPRKKAKKWREERLSIITKRLPTREYVDNRGQLGFEKVALCGLRGFWQHRFSQLFEVYTPVSQQIPSCNFITSHCQSM